MGKPSCDILAIYCDPINCSWCWLFPPFINLQTSAYHHKPILKVMTNIDKDTPLLPFPFWEYIAQIWQHQLVMKITWSGSQRRRKTRKAHQSPDTLAVFQAMLSLLYSNLELWKPLLKCNLLLLCCLLSTCSSSPGQPPKKKFIRKTTSGGVDSNLWVWEVSSQAEWVPESELTHNSMHRCDHINQLIYLILNISIPLTSYLSYSGLDELAIARSERPLPTKSRSVCAWLTARARSSRRLAGDPPGRRKKRIASTTEAKPTSAPSDPIYTISKFLSTKSFQKWRNKKN